MTLPPPARSRFTLHKRFTGSFIGSPPLLRKRGDLEKIIRAFESWVILILMEQDTSKLDEIQTSRDALRERLRAKAEEIVAAVEALPEPKTFLEAERAARMVILADKMVERVFSEPKVVKPRPHKAQVHRTVAAPIVMDSAVTPPPPSFACAGEDEEETPLSKTYLKLEQLAAKITALDVEFNGQKSTQRSP